MAVQFGVFVPQGWRIDLVEIRDPVEQFEAMTAVAKAADADRPGTRSGSTTIFTPCPRRSWRPPSSAGRSPRPWRATPTGSRSARWSPATATATPPLRQDRLHGRRGQPRPALCGIGAGWYEHEWRAYGYGFPETPRADGHVPRGRRDHPQDVDRGLARRSTASTTRSTSRSTSRRACASRTRRSGSAAAARRSR